MLISLGTDNATRSAGWGRRRLAAALVAALVALVCPIASGPEPAAAQGAGPRVALVIANAHYPDADRPLASAAADAEALAAELAQDGFQVTTKTDLGRLDMRATIEDFLGRIAPGSTALFYFNGIGLQADRRSYLVPVDAKVWTVEDVAREGVSLDDVLVEMQNRGAAVKLVVVDASRRNPFERRFRAYAAGLAALDAPEGGLVVYAAAPNTVGPDDAPGQSLFMQQWLKELGGPGVDVERAAMRTRIGVSRASKGESVPWVASALVDPVILRASAPPVPPASAPTSPPPAAEPAPPPPVVAAPVAPTAAAPVAEVAAAPPPAPPAPPLPRPAPAPTVQAVAPPPGPAASAKAFRDCETCPEMVVVPAGTFRMGTGTTPVDRPAHPVTIVKPFAIGRTEVTIAAWDACVAESRCAALPAAPGPRDGALPVTNVSWADAQAYVGWLSDTTGRTYRLPSEAEWEYAAHGGTATPFAWGATVGTGMANCADCGRPATRRPTPVMGFPANGFGLSDMAGNAAEWVQDCWNETYRGAPRDGSPWTSGDCARRVLRGGSFDSASAYVKPAARFRYDADVRYWTNGFRVALSLP